MFLRLNAGASLLATSRCFTGSVSKEMPPSPSPTSEMSLLTKIPGSSRELQKYLLHSVSVSFWAIQSLGPIESTLSCLRCNEKKFVWSDTDYIACGTVSSCRQTAQICQPLTYHNVLAHPLPSMAISRSAWMFELINIAIKYLKNGVLKSVPVISIPHV